MTEGKNFSGQATPSIVDTEYRWCTFSFPAPIDVAGKKRGVRLFPGDDTPRTFINCGMMNVEPPPGSTLTRSRVIIKGFGVVTSSDTITIDGASETVEHHSDFVYGKYDPATGDYVDLATPQEKVID